MKIDNRKSNIELLRIIAFIMIIFNHVIPGGLFASNDVLSQNFYWDYAILIEVIGKPAVLIFVLISGYVTFFNQTINVKKKIKKLLIPICCFIPILIVSTIIVYGNGIFNTIFTIGKDFLCFQGLFYHLWYLWAYIIIVIISPIIIKAINYFERKYIKKCLILFCVLISINTFVNVVFNNFILGSLFYNQFLCMLMIYSFGFYINKYNVKIKKRFLALLLIGSCLINFIIFSIKNSPLKIADLSFFNSLNIFIIISAATTFLLFKELNIKSKIINYISKRTYGAYVIHTFCIYIIALIIPFAKNYNSKYFILYNLLFVFLVATFSILLEIIREKVEKKVVIIYNKNRLKGR